jgi:FAD synthase
MKAFFRGFSIPVEIAVPVTETSARERAGGRERISSSHIRALIASGNLSKAAEMLGRPVELDLTGCASRREEGRMIFEKPGVVLPPEGAYAGIVRGAGEPVELHITRDGVSIPSLPEEVEQTCSEDLIFAFI